MATKTGALGQRPANSFEKKLVGIVNVKVGETKARFTLTEDGKTFKDGSTSLTVRLSDLPRHPKLTTEDSGKSFRIRMNNEGTDVEALTPVTGVFDMRLTDLGPRPEGPESDPTPFERVFDEGGPKENRHLEFFAVYEIANGKFKGVKLPAYHLHYKFEEDEDGMTRFAGNTENKKATRLHQLVDWGNIHNLWEKPITWDDDSILPELLDRALESDVIVRGVFKDGYIRELLPSEDAGNPYEDEEDDDIEEDRAAKVDEMLDEAPKKKPNGKVKDVQIKYKVPAAKQPVKKIVSKRKLDEDEDL